MLVGVNGTLPYVGAAGRSQEKVLWLAGCATDQGFLARTVL
jgi:hypothetical protein